MDLSHVLFTLLSIGENIGMRCEIQSHFVHLVFSEELFTEIVCAVIKDIKVDLVGR